MRGKVLLIDDDPHILSFLKEHLTLNDFTVSDFNSPTDAIDHFQNNSYDLVLSDVKMNEMTGDEVLRHVKKKSPETGVILMTGYGSINHTVNAMRRGAFDYITKPFSSTEILSRINYFFKHKEEQEQTYEARYQKDATIASPTKRIEKQESNPEPGHVRLVGESPKIKKLLNILPQIARNNAPIMIQGDSGTGKEVYARLIQQNSNRSKAPYITINCANLPSELVESTLFGHVKGAFTGAISDKKGAFEEADGGTLLLDEITEIDINIQAKLLRVLQEGEFQRVGSQKLKKVDVRIISTTNRDITKTIQEGKFRSDLYFRLNVFPIKMPSLNERVEDIPVLANYFCEKYAEQYSTEPKSISGDLKNYLISQNWDGNVRQLENFILRGILMSGDAEIIETSHVINNLFGDFGQEIKEDKINDIPLLPIEEMEKKLIQKALKRTNGNQKEAAKILKISDRTIRNKLKNYSATVAI